MATLRTSPKEQYPATAEQIQSACDAITEALEAYDYMTFGDCRYEVRTQANIGNADPTTTTRLALQSLLDRGLILPTEDDENEVYELSNFYYNQGF